MQTLLVLVLISISSEFLSYLEVVHKVRMRFLTPLALVIGVVLAGLLSGCDPNTPDNTTSEPPRPPVYHDVAGAPALGALSTCTQLTTRSEFVNNVNASWAMKACNWNPTSATGRKEALCVGYDGVKYDFVFEPVAYGDPSARVYAWRTYWGGDGSFHAFGPYADGLAGSCLCWNGAAGCGYLVRVLQP